MVSLSQGIQNKPWIVIPAGSYLNGASGTLAYRLTFDGRHLELAGNVIVGAAGLTFNFPAQYRPLTTRVITAGNSSVGYSYCELSPAGNLTLFGAPGTNVTITDVFPLDY